MTFQVTVTGPDGPIQDVLVTGGDMITGESFPRITDGAGYADVAMLGRSRAGDACAIIVQDLQLRYQGAYLARTLHGDERITISLVPFRRPVASLPDLVIAGQYFRLATGTLFTVKEATAFNLLGRLVQEGEPAILPVVDELQELGFNFVRVWTSYAGMGPNGAAFEREIGRLLPSEHPDLYQAAPELSRICARRGLYIEFTGYTGPDDGVGGVTPDHWLHLGEVLQPVRGQVLGELVNEHNAHPSLRNIQAYQPLPNICCSRGSNGSDAVPPRPWFPTGYELIHTNESFEWWRKGGHNGLEFSDGTRNPDGSIAIVASHRPVIENEKRRSDKDPTLRHHEDSARAAAALIAGSCFHSQSGKRAVNFSAFDRPFAEAFIRGANSFDLRFQDGRYDHHRVGDRYIDEGPDDLRVYRKVLPTGEYTLVPIRK